MRASSSWIKLQFVVRKHVMNTYQMHTLSPFFYFITFSPPLFPFCPVFDFFFLFVFWLQPLSLWLAPSPCCWWSVILMRRIQMCCIMHLFECTSVCICVCVFPFLGAYTYVRRIWGLCASVILSLSSVMTRAALGPLERAPTNCGQTWLSPHHRPPRGCPHLEAVVERARCVGVERGGPGEVQAGTGCMNHCRRWQPIWGCEERERRWWRRIFHLSVLLRAECETNWLKREKHKNLNQIHRIPTTTSSLSCTATQTCTYRMVMTLFSQQWPSFPAE